MATNLIVGLLLLLVPCFFSGYNNVEATSSAAIIIARTPRWQNTTAKRTSLTLPSDFAAHSSAQTVTQETQTNKLTSEDGVRAVAGSSDGPADFQSSSILPKSTSLAGLQVVTTSSDVGSHHSGTSTRIDSSLVSTTSLSTVTTITNTYRLLLSKSHSVLSMATSLIILSEDTSSVLSQSLGITHTKALSQLSLIITRKNSTLIPTNPAEAITTTAEISNGVQTLNTLPISSKSNGPIVQSATIAYAKANLQISLTSTTTDLTLRSVNSLGTVTTTTQPSNRLLRSTALPLISDSSQISKPIYTSPDSFSGASQSASLIPSSNRYLSIPTTLSESTQLLSFPSTRPANGESLTIASNTFTFSHTVSISVPTSTISILVPTRTISISVPTSTISTSTISASVPVSTISILIPTSITSSLVSTNIISISILTSTMSILVPTNTTSISNPTSSAIGLPFTSLNPTAFVSISIFSFNVTKVIATTHALTRTIPTSPTTLWSLERFSSASDVALSSLVSLSSKIPAKEIAAVLLPGSTGQDWMGWSSTTNFTLATSMIGSGSSSAKLLSIFPVLTSEIVLSSIAVGGSYSGALTSSQILEEPSALVTSFRTIVSNDKYHATSTTTQTQVPNDGTLFGNSLQSHAVKAKSIGVTLGAISGVLAFAAAILLLLRLYRRRQQGAINTKRPVISRPFPV